MPIAIYHHAAADGTLLPSESCVCEDDVYTNNGDDETIGVPLVRLSDARAAIQQAAGAVPDNLPELLQSCRGSDKSALLFHESSFVEICDALDDHITSVRAKFCNKQAA